MNACEMVNRCFRHQWPEVYGGASVDEPDIPQNLRYGGGGSPDNHETLPDPEGLGHPGAVPLP